MPILTISTNHHFDAANKQNMQINFQKSTKQLCTLANEKLEHFDNTLRETIDAINRMVGWCRNINANTVAIQILQVRKSFVRIPRFYLTDFFYIIDQGIFDVSIVPTRIAHNIYAAPDTDVTPMAVNSLSSYTST